LTFFYSNFNFLDTFPKNPQISNIMNIHAVGVDGNDETNGRSAQARNVQDVELKSGPYFNMSNLFTKIYNML